MKKTKIILPLLSLLFLSCATAQTFKPSPVKLGELSLDLVPESSGLAYSEKLNTLFHINDSGDGAFVYTSAKDGSNLTKWSYKSSKPKDVEDLAIGPCYLKSEKLCLYVADIGDNSEKRSHIILTLLDLEDFDQSKMGGKDLKPYRTLKLNYPDRAHNAESLVVDLEGNIFVLTKEWNEKTKETFASFIYQFSGNDKSLSADETYTFKKVSTVDLTKLLPNLPWWAQTPTALDVNFNEDLALVLTYAGIVTLKWSEMLVGVDASTKHSFLVGPELPQQEAITFIPEGFIYSTEYVEDYGTPDLYFWSFTW